MLINLEPDLEVIDNIHWFWKVLISKFPLLCSFSFVMEEKNEI